MPSEDTKILEFNQYWKSDKTPSIICANLESLIKKIDGCKNNPEKSCTIKLGEHILCGYSVYTIWTLMVLKIIMIYTEVMIAGKSFVNP